MLDLPLCFRVQSLARVAHRRVRRRAPGTERGVLVTRFWYIRSLDPQTILLTGLTRDGLFLIENLVDEARVTSNGAMRTLELVLRLGGGGNGDT